MNNLVNELKKNVWDLNRCSGCGLCVSTCAKNIIRFNESEEHPILDIKEKSIGLSSIIIDTCFFCEKLCEESCPRLKEWGNGPLIRILSAISKIPNISVINALLASAIKWDLIDGVILWDMEWESFKPIPKIIMSEEKVLKSMDYQYIWFPILKSLNNAIYDEELSKIAIVGPSCIAQAAKTLLSSTNKKLKIYRERISLIIGLFCEGTYSHQLIDEIVNRFNINPYDINTMGIDLKDKILRIKLHNGLEKIIPLLDIRRYMRGGCIRCTDFTSEWADISIGNVGLENGKTIIIVRTNIGERCLNYAIRDKAIEIIEETTSIDELKKFILDKERRRRVQEVDSLILSMLNAISNMKKLRDVDEKLRLIMR